MNQNLKILAISVATFFISVSFWILLLGNKTSDQNTPHLIDTAEQIQSNLIFHQPNSNYRPPKFR